MEVRRGEHKQLVGLNLIEWKMAQGIASLSVLTWSSIIGIKHNKRLETGSIVVEEGVGKEYFDIFYFGFWMLLRHVCG